MDSITVGRPIKNRLGAHACHSFLSVPASQTVVSLCTLYYLLAIFASIQFILSFAGGQTGKPFGWTLFVCLYILLIFLFSSLDLEHQCRVRLYITTVFFFVCLFPCPTSSLCSFPSSSPLCPDLEMLWASTNGDAYDPHGQINHRYHSYKYSNEQIILR